MKPDILRIFVKQLSELHQSSGRLTSVRLKSCQVAVNLLALSQDPAYSGVITLFSHYQPSDLHVLFVQFLNCFLPGLLGRFSFFLRAFRKFSSLYGSGKAPLPQSPCHNI
jgi:hypothetical protein